MATDIFKRGSVEMLALLLLTDSDSHGYELCQKIREYSDGMMVIQEGSLYPVLYRLSGDGFISAKEELIKTKTGRSRVMVHYHIEEAGRKRLDELKIEYDKVHLGIRTIFERCSYSPELPSKNN